MMGDDDDEGLHAAVSEPPEARIATMTDIKDSYAAGLVVGMRLGQRMHPAPPDAGAAWEAFLSARLDLIFHWDADMAFRRAGAR